MKSTLYIKEKKEIYKAFLLDDRYYITKTTSIEPKYIIKITKLI